MLAYALYFIGLAAIIGATWMALRGWGPLHAIGTFVALGIVVYLVPFGGFLVILPAAAIYGSGRSAYATKVANAD